MLKIGNQSEVGGVYRHVKIPRRLLFVASGVMLMFALGSSTSAQDPAELFHKMQNALGGAEAIAAIRDYEELVRAVTWNNEGKLNGEVRKRTRWIRPNYLRLDQMGPDDTYVLYFDGTSGWEILPDKTFANLAGGELKFAQRYLRDFKLNVWLADRDPRYLITSPAPNVVRLTDREDATQWLEITLDKVSLRPVKQTSISLADPSHPVSRETRFAEWETVQGIQLPRRIIVFEGDARVAEIAVEQVKLDSGLKPAHLATKPSDLMPVLSER